MKVKLLACGAVVLAIFLAIWGYGNSLIAVGERESRWIMKDMWGVEYFNVRLGGIKEYERKNLLSLEDGSSKSQELITYVINNKCEDASEQCYLIMTSASNLLIDGGEHDSGLRGMVEAANRVEAKDFCPIAYESAILKYKLKALSYKSVGTARSASRDILKKIRLNGGLVKSLKTESCVSLSRIKPEFFHEYAVLVAQLMGFAGGDLAKAGAYINSAAL